jgi:hypothetical protein
MCSVVYVPIAAEPIAVRSQLFLLYPSIDILLSHILFGEARN